MSSTSSRRAFLRSALVLAVGTVGVDLLAACRPTTPDAQSPSGTSAPAVARAGATPQSSPINTYSLKGDGSGGTLRIGMTATNVPIPDTPTTEGGEGTRFVGTQIYEGLTRLNTNQAEQFCVPVPGMAESWTLGDDQLAWTFKLRQI